MRLLAICFLAIHIACQMQSTEDERLQQSYPIYIQSSDSIIQFQFSSEVIFNWSNADLEIVHDSLYKQIEENFDKHEKLIISLISDTTKTPAIGCLFEIPLVMGDLAFLLIHKRKNILFSEELDLQFDTFGNDCNYPYGLFRHLKLHRLTVQENLYKYFIIDGLEVNKLSE